MRKITDPTLDAGEYCAYCGHAVATEGPVIERFGQSFCSEPHAEDFAAGVRASRMEAAAKAEPAPPGSCGVLQTSRPTWKDRLKRGACWGGPLLLLLAIPLFWSGGAVAVAGGSVLSALAVLACPLGMYFMMRAMGSMNHGKQDTPTSEAVREEKR